MYHIVLGFVNMRHAARTDDNQPAIIEAMRAVGAKVYYLKLPLDLLVWFRGRYLLMEVKDPDGRLTKAQVEFIGSWPGEVHVVVTPQEALRALMGDKLC